MTAEHVSQPELGAFVLGGLAAFEHAQVRAHLVSCPSCNQSLAELQAARQLLDNMPPEFFLDGAPEDGDVVAERAIRQIRSEQSIGRNRRRRLIGAAATVGAILLLGVGVLGGRQLTPVTAPTLTVATTAPATRLASGTDPQTGARLTVSVIPAAGWVRIAATVEAMPAGERCRLVVVGADGEREIAGSWLVSARAEPGESSLSGFALVDPADVSEVLIENFAGRQFVAVAIS